MRDEIIDADATVIEDSEIVVSKDHLPETFTDEESVNVAIARVRAEVDAHPADLKTRKGREALASIAHKPRRFKKPVTDFIKGKTDGHYAEIKRLNGLRDKFLGAMTDIADAARKPLDEWENREKERVAALKSKLDEIKAIDLPATVEAVDEMIAHFKAMDISEETFAEFADDATNERNAVIVRLVERKDHLEREKALEAERQRQADELARQAERAEQERLEREAAAAKREAEMQAEIAAQQKEIERLRREASESRPAPAEDSKEQNEVADDRQQSPAPLADGAEPQMGVSSCPPEQTAAAPSVPDDEPPQTQDQALTVAVLAIVSHGADRIVAERIVNAVQAGDVPHIHWAA